MWFMVQCIMPPIDLGSRPKHTERVLSSTHQCVCVVQKQQEQRDNRVLFLRGLLECFGLCQAYTKRTTNSRSIEGAARAVHVVHQGT
mmetsp:Transcript_61295/g.101296  ORF Transcript_61295/g.101296 Transcript_61295/m.101296 type:complete len:87 (-) Transcript_61295:41-301(-)